MADASPRALHESAVRAGARDAAAAVRHRAGDRAGLGRPRDADAALPGARGDRPRGRDHRRRRLPRDLGPLRLGRTTTPTSRRERLTSPSPLATLLDMPQTHVPVLAGELIEALDPRPGQIADRLHARRRRSRAARRRAARADRHADRHRPRPDRRGRRSTQLAAEVACETRFIRADFVTGLAAADRGGRARGPRLHGSRHELDAGRQPRARLRLRLRRAAGHADGPRPGAHGLRDRQHLGPPPARARAARLRRGALRRPDRGRDRPPPRPRQELATTFELNEAITAAIPAPARFAGGHPPSARSRRSGSPSTASSQQLDEALPLRVGAS